MLHASLEEGQKGRSGEVRSEGIGSEAGCPNVVGQICFLKILFLLTSCPPSRHEIQCLCSHVFGFLYREGVELTLHLVKIVNVEPG